MKRYIVTFADDGLHLYGPFPEGDCLKSFGTAWQADHDDDPRWNEVHLEEPHRGRSMVLPIEDPEAFPY